MLCASKSSCALRLQLIPVRGRKQFALTHACEPFDYNLSPQGDGNSKLLGWKYVISDYNLSPQGDGNLENRHNESPFLITTYPRKGTVTSALPCRSNRAQGLQLIPARGRKLSIYVTNGKELHCNLSLQGDGNSSSMSRLFSRYIAIYPRKGTKKHLCHWRLPAAEVLCFFLIFYFTGWKLCQPESSL